MNMNVINGRNEDCCGNDGGLLGANDFPFNRRRGCCGDDFCSNRRGCCGDDFRSNRRGCCGDDGFRSNRRGCCGNDGLLGINRGNRCGCSCRRCGCRNQVVTSCKLICTDRDGNGICNCVFTVQSENGNCRTIDLRNCDNSCEFPLCEGCNVIENIATPRGIEMLQGRIFCDVSSDCCGRPTTVVSSDSNIDDQICVRRECGTTIIICKFDRVAGSGCDNGCDCNRL